MAGKHKKVSKGMLLTWFVLGGMILFFAPYSLTSKIQGSFVYMFGWPLKIGRGISLSAQSKYHQDGGINRLQYEQLQNHLSNVIAERDLAYEKLNKVSGLRNRFPLEGASFVQAGITMSGGKIVGDEFVINRGSSDQISPGQFVLADNSVVGIVMQVWSRSARVVLTTNPRFNKAVRVEGLDSNLMMTGAGNGFSTILAKYKAESGKDIILLPQAGFLESSIIIGRVSECRRNGDNPLLWDIIVKPACDVVTLTDVAVVVMNPQKEPGK